MTARMIGDPVRRKEDLRFLTGKGHYTDDINRAGQVYAVFVRSPHAHAEIKSIATKRAAGAPSVVAVYTGADLIKAGLGTLPCGWGVKNKDGSPMTEPPHPVLASGKVRHVGDPVAIVIAGPVSGAGVNPARAIGPMILAGQFPDWWAYLAAPLAGGAVAVALYDRFLRAGSTPA